MELEEAASVLLTLPPMSLGILGVKMIPLRYLPDLAN